MWMKLKVMVTYIFHFGEHCRTVSTSECVVHSQTVCYDPGT
jgi:hypothetical protein